MLAEDTIAAIATPLGEGGLAVIRISVSQALAVADRCFVPVGRLSKPPSLSATHTLHFCHVLSKRQSVYDQLLQIAAPIAAPLHFPDADIAPATCAQSFGRLQSGVHFMAAVLHSVNEGQILRRGLRAAIIGPPNAGKSCLVNQLRGHDRAIV